MSSSGISISVTPTVGTAAYIAGDSIGGIIDLGSFTGLSGDTFIIDSFELIDKSKTHWAGILEIFQVTPTGGTYTDGSPLVYGSADHAQSTGGPYSILAGDWLDLHRVSATVSKVKVSGINDSVYGTGTHLYMLIHADSSFSLTAGDLTIKIGAREA